MKANKWRFSFYKNFKKCIDNPAFLWYYNLVAQRHHIKWRSRVAGRARTIGNRVTVKSGSRVRISPSPPKKIEGSIATLYLFLLKDIMI